MRTIVKLTSVFATAAIMLAGCYPKGPEYYSDTDLTVTDYDMDYDFEGQKNYFMADTVEYITNQKDDEISERDQEKLIQEVESNFALRGYTRLAEEDAMDAEFVVAVTVTSTKNTGAGYIPGPPWYPSWPWGPGWGGYYPPYWG